MDLNQRKFHFFDILRGAFQGILETWWLSVGLLVGIKLFSAPDLVKSAVAAANYLGLLFSPIFVYIAMKRNLLPGYVLFFCLSACALFLLFCTSFESLSFLLCFYLLAAAFNDVQWPFLTQMYGVGYPEAVRGRRLGWVLTVLLLSGSLFAWWSGRLLDHNLQNYKWLLFCAALAAFGAALCGFFMQKSLPRKKVSLSYFSGLKAVVRDRPFLRLLASWMLLGLANTMVLPLRILYLTGEEYGLEFSSEKITLLTLSVLFMARIFSTPLWGFIYDRLSFPQVRDLVCFFFAAGILVFFHSSSLYALAFGSVLSGIGMGGGFLLWNIWVTDYAPKSQLLSYMSVNVFFTGIRGAVAPFLGFWISRYYGLEAAVYLGVLGLVLASFIRR